MASAMARHGAHHGGPQGHPGRRPGDRRPPRVLRPGGRDGPATTGRASRGSPSSRRRTSPTTPWVRPAARLHPESRTLNPEASAEFRVEFGGAIAPGLGKGNITRPVADRLEMEAARFTARYDIDASRPGGGWPGSWPSMPRSPTSRPAIGMMAESAEYLNVYFLAARTPPLDDAVAHRARGEHGRGGRRRSVPGPGVALGLVRGRDVRHQEPRRPGRRPDHPGRQADAAVLGQGGAEPGQVRDHARDGLRHGDPQAGRASRGCMWRPAAT